MDDPEFASIDPEFRQMKRAQLEAVVIGVPPGLSVEYAARVSQAKAELVRRDREFADEQERSRRKFEADRDSDRENHDLRMFDEAGVREAARQEFEEKLAQRQMDHAATLAKEQLSTAQSAAKAARMAAWAAVAAAVGAILQVLIAAMK